MYSIAASSEHSAHGVGVAVKRKIYGRKVDVDMLKAIKSVLADVSIFSPSSEQSSLSLL